MAMDRPPRPAPDCCIVEMLRRFVTAVSSSAALNAANPCEPRRMSTPLQFRLGDLGAHREPGRGQAGHGRRQRVELQLAVAQHHQAASQPLLLRRHAAPHRAGAAGLLALGEKEDQHLGVRILAALRRNTQPSQRANPLKQPAVTTRSSHSFARLHSRIRSNKGGIR